MSVRNGIALLLALAALSFLIACGGSSSPKVVPPPSGAFNNNRLSGTYVFSILGTDANSSTASFFALVGTLTADGSGNITGGTVDINDPNIGGFFPSQPISATTYTITSDGRGFIRTLVTPNGTFALDFVLTSSAHGLISRFDAFGSGSGTLDLQSSASQSSLQSLAFSLTGTDASSTFLLGSVGAFTLDASGNVTSGTQDFNEGGSSAGIADLPMTTPGSSLVLSSSTSGTAVLDTSFGSLTFNVWVVDSTHLKLIETDAAAVLSGDAFTQQTSISSGQLAFTVAGADSTGNALVAGGLATSDGNGNLTNGIEDFNDGGVPGTQSPFTGTCTSFVAGRCQLALTGFSNGVAQAFQFAAYPSSGGVQLLEVDSFGQMQGAAYVQTATSFAASEGYGLNLSGTNGHEVDDIAEFTAGTSNVTGILDENDLGAPLAPVTLSGTYTPDSPADGRGSISVPNLKTFIGTLNLEYYVVDSSTVLFIEGDSSQLGVGTFQLQNTPGSGGAAQAHLSIMRPAIRSHAALRRK
jgi:hypothetical protein